MNTADKIEIVICLGSSCFSRGNKSMVKQIDDYIKAHRLTERVFYHGSHCFGACEKGPVMRIGNNFYYQVTPENLHKILYDNFGY
ncbi:MAG: NAD(P)H-dependent oxidoreductase subunit E [Bacteroidales bacterium]|nr:NAD(P)H-dependent oxidoreductase subunit E [Bacteroidales bacterium]